MSASKREKKQKVRRKTYLKRKCRKLSHAPVHRRIAEVGEESQRKVREENARSNDQEFGKSERENEEWRSLKTKAQKTEIQWETPLIKTCHVATACVAPPLCI